MMGVCVLVRRTQEALVSLLPLPLPREDAGRRRPSANQEEGRHQSQEEGRVKPSEPHHVDTLISEFPASKALRNKSLFFKPLSL